jgi:aspartyl-tRNA(Asn)/glutamyl-tRNA(Gln) amidotransferase subunit A
MELHKLTLLETLEGLKERRFTSVELTQVYLDRIERVNPKINAYLSILKDSALENARAADLLITQNGEEAFVDKPLLGVPYACKDNFCTYGIATTASSKILANFIPPYESTVTAKLKSAGAVLLGKTNMDAFAHGSSTETSDYGTTLNPWDLTRVAGGSSGGSAAAVAANLAVFAIGSETAGSIRGPASWCGVSGFKPSYGRVSRYGVIAMASSTDSPGPIGKSIVDCSYVAEIIAGNDPHDATSSSEEINFNYSELLAGSDLRGKRIGVARSYFVSEMDEDVKARILDALRVFENMGAEVIDIELMDPKYSIAVYTILQRSEVSSNLGRFDGIRYGSPREVFNTENKKRILLGSYTLSSGYYDQFYTKAQKVRTLIINDFNKAFEKVDVLFGPSMPVTALKVGQSEESPMFGEMMDILYEPSAIAGLCAVSVPCGFVKNLPVGYQLIGPRFKEESVLTPASLYQTQTYFHRESVEL